MTDTVPVAVIVSTRNPDARILETVTSVLASDEPHFRLHVVDQGDRVDTRKLLGSLLDDPRVQYRHLPGVGLSIARNAGVRLAEPAELLAFTDDDCSVSPSWLSQITAPLERDARIGLVFGVVQAAPHDPELGFIPSYSRSEPIDVRSIRDKHRVEGMGASMAIRRSLWTALDGFDEALGAGGPMHSAEETDFVIRALLAGFHAYETPDAVVVHSGFRTWAQAPRVFRDYLHGIGAAMVKQLKCGHLSISIVAAHLAWRWLTAEPVIDLGNQSHRWSRMAGFLSGVSRGAITPVDRRTGHFRLGP